MKKKKKIEGNMTFSEIIKKYPEVIEILTSKGMHCFGCPMSMQETLKDGVKAHKLKIKEILKELNQRIEK